MKIGIDNSLQDIRRAATWYIWLQVGEGILSIGLVVFVMFMIVRLIDHASVLFGIQ